MSRRRLTYAEMAEQLGVTRCRGINPRTGATCFEDHARGSYRDGMVHWGERSRITRSAVRRFLLLCSASNVLVATSSAGWQRTYMANLWVVDAARRLGIRLPRDLAANDRARVRAAVSSLPTDTPARSAALAWASR